MDGLGERSVGRLNANVTVISNYGRQNRDQKLRTLEAVRLTRAL
jgi:hypothetical protein